VELSLATERLCLRPFRADDRDAFAEWADDDAYLRYLGAGHPGADEFVAHNVVADGERELAWVVTLRDSDRIVGAVFLGVDRTDGVAELACLLGPRYWGAGIATEAGRAVIDFAFGPLGLAKVWARAAAGNAGSIRGMEKLGMRAEGRLRAHRVGRDGERVDELLYAVLRDEWQ
jgi:RimJ/RimL family protein N-acetyltransferase